jgi:hypothetical protein
MKKNFVFAMLFAVCIAGSAFANDPVNVKNVVRESFTREFAGAQAVSWEVVSSKEIFHASFTYNNERLNAYFDSEGVLLATGRYVKPESLPMLVSRGIQTDYSSFKVIETIEFITGAETSYIVKLQNEKFSMYVQAYSDGSTSVLKKEKKNSVAKL